MKIARFDHNDKATVSFKLKDVINSCLTGLEKCLKHFKNEMPDSLANLVEILVSEHEKVKDHGIIIDIDHEILNHHPELVKRCMNQVLTLLEYSKYSEHSTDELIEIDAVDLVRTFNLFEYSFMSSLLRIMPHKDAIDYIKKMADDFAHLNNNPDNYVATLDDLLARFKSGSDQWQMQSTVAEIIDDKRMLYKVNRCEWAEVLKGNDLELCYSMMCYQDFENTKNHNPNFLLTRTKTILMGDDYCDFCYHDKRKDQDLTHPSQDWFLKLE